MRKIRVLEFSHQRDWGGTDKSSQLMLQHYDRSKFDVFAASYVGGPRAQWIKDQNIPQLITQNDQDMVDWLKALRIDVVHFYRGGWEEHRDVRIFKDAGIPVLLERNCFAMFDPSADRYLIDKHLMCSQASVQIYKDRSGHLYDSNKVQHIYVPTDCDMFSGLKRDWDAPTFGRVSRKDPSKWSPINIYSLPYIKEAVPNAKFHVVGLPDQYWPLIEQLNVKSMIVEHVLPTDQHLVDFLQKITIFAHSSQIGESFGNAMAEAMASELPVVTHWGGDGAQAELTTDGYNGYVVDPNDPKAYADKIIYLLQNPVQKRVMGYYGFERANKLFGVTNVVKQFEDLYITECQKKGIV